MLSRFGGLTYGCRREPETLRNFRGREAGAGRIGALAELLAKPPQRKLKRLFRPPRHPQLQASHHNRRG